MERDTDTTKELVERSEYATMDRNAGATTKDANRNARLAKSTTRKTSISTSTNTTISSVSIETR